MGVGDKVKLLAWMMISTMGPFRGFILGDDQGVYHPCLRDCVKNVTMICRYNFTLEHFVTMGRSCEYCEERTRLQLARVPDCQCVYGDGYERGVLTVNRMIPGPSVQVCKGDEIVVDVANRMDGTETTIHWHGIDQNGSQYYDGVPFVTQCPIHGGNRFRYRFRADRAGTHFYHSHSSVQKLDGLYGSLVVRLPREDDPHGDVYDHDLPEHTLVLSDFLHASSSDRIPGFTESDTGQYPEVFLINGRGRFFDRQTKRSTQTPYEELWVKPGGGRYRLRLVNALGTTCDARFSIEGHSLTIISSDGHDVVPIVVDSLVSFSGERYDVVIDTKTRARPIYWMQVYSEECYVKEVHQIGMLRYAGLNDGNNLLVTRPPPTYTRRLPPGKIYRNACDGESPHPCVMDLHSLHRSHSPSDRRFLDEPDVSLYMPYELFFYQGREPYVPNTYRHFILPPSTRPLTALMDGISFITPPVPPLSQPEDLEPSALCNSRENLPPACASKQSCVCTHTVRVALGQLVEIVLVDYSENINTSLSHPFHLHGHSFRVVAHGQIPTDSSTKMSRGLVESMLEASRRKLGDAANDNISPHPPVKDTLVISHSGYAVLRIVMDNPGYWFFHCHFGYHIVVGMNMIFRVGEFSDLPDLPRNFPKCGDFVGPD